MVRALEWIDSANALRVIDQTLLPAQERYLDITTVDDLVDAIRSLAVRGAPALGAAGAFGVVIAMNEAVGDGWDEARLASEVDRIRRARPTAVNLAWGVEQAWLLAPQGVTATLAKAKQVMTEDEAANRRLSKLGADWLLNRCGRNSVSVVTHCNTGGLATTAWGTAYGIIHELHRRGSLTLAYSDETRPLLQGARLTCWEFTQDGIPFVVQADGAASSTILNGRVDAAIIGADRIAANGDTANKIGSVALALACQRKGIPFIVAAPFSTVDLAIASGDEIAIEERDQKEVLEFSGVRTTPPNAVGFNPAFDVTPYDLISAIVTERGVIEPAGHGNSLSSLAI